MGPFTVHAVFQFSTKCSLFSARVEEKRKEVENASFRADFMKVPKPEWNVKKVKGG